MSLRLRLVERTTRQYKYKHVTSVQSYPNLPLEIRNLTHWCISTGLRHSTLTRSISAIRKLDCLRLLSKEQRIIIKNVSADVCIILLQTATRKNRTVYNGSKKKN